MNTDIGYYIVESLLLFYAVIISFWLSLDINNSILKLLEFYDNILSYLILLLTFIIILIYSLTWLFIIYSLI